MLAKLTSKNQLTLPKAVVQQVGTPEYFEIATLDGRIVLTPVKLQKSDAVRSKMESLGITEQDIQDAVNWARAGE
jgi:hypothetical protein